MAGHDMAAEFVADFQRPLEIDPCSSAPLADRGELQRLGRGVDLEDRALASFPRRDDGEAGPRAGDRGAKRDAFQRIGTSDGEAAQRAALLDLLDLADVGDDSREHSAHFLVMRDLVRAEREGVGLAIKRGVFEHGARGGPQRMASPRRRRLWARVQHHHIHESGRKQGLGQPRAALAEDARDAAPRDSASAACGGTRPRRSALTRATSAPVASEKRFASSSDTLVKAMTKVGTVRASAAKRERGEIVRLLSMTTRRRSWSSMPGRRTVSSGSSSRAVPRRP